MSRLALGIVVGVGLLLYLRSPIDLIPDRAGAVGLLDDLLALGVGAWWFWKRLPKIPSGASSSSRSEGGGTSPERFDPYEVLGISRGASQEQIRQAYHECLRQYHPDRVDGLGDELQKLALDRTLDIRRAYDELKA